MIHSESMPAEIQPRAPFEEGNGSENNRTQWSDFYNRWGKRISQLAGSGVASRQPDYDGHIGDLSNRRIPNGPPAGQIQNSKSEDLGEQLISERGDLQGFV